MIARATSTSCSARPRKLGTHFLVRTCVDRLAGDGDHTIADEMDEVAVKGLHRIEVRDSNGDPDEAVLEIRYRKIRVLPPIGKQKRYPALTLTVIHAEERGTPKNRKKIEWKLITDLPVALPRGRHREARMVCFAMEDRGVPQDPQIGLQSRGIEAQDRPAPDQSDRGLLHPELAGLLDDDAQSFSPGRAANSRVDRDRNRRARSPRERQTAKRDGRTLSHYLTKIARLGGYLARANDPPPGNTSCGAGYRA